MPFCAMLLMTCSGGSSGGRGSLEPADATSDHKSSASVALSASAASWPAKNSSIAVGSIDRTHAR